MKILKALAIAYLLWAVFYSLTAGRAWVGDALAFKLNGGPQLVSQLESDGFKVTGTQVEADRNFSALSLSKQNILAYSDLDYHWGKGSAVSVNNTLRAYRKDPPIAFKQTIRIDKQWAIWVGLDEREGGKFATIKKTVDKLKINLTTLTWHPISETRFLFWMNKGGGPPPELEGVMPLLLLFGILDLLFIQPIFVFWAFVVAFSPPQVAQLTAYSPVLIYGFLIVLLTKKLLKK